MAASISAPDTGPLARNPHGLNHPVARVKRHKKTPALTEGQDGL